MNDKYLKSLLSIKDKKENRRLYFDLIYDTFKKQNICLIGLRQVGKTTLMLH